MNRKKWASRRQRRGQSGPSPYSGLGLGRSRARRPRFEPLEERRLLAITVNTLVDELDGSILDGDVSLRDAIAAAPSGETINFDASLSGATITLNLGELVLDTSIKIDARALAGGITIDASGNDLTPAVDKGDGSRVFRITDEQPGAIAVELHGLTLTGGDVSGNGGAVLFRRAGSLTITGSTLAGNSATAGGGLWAQTIDGGAVRLLTSTVSGNASKSKAGGVYADAANNGTLEIRDSTISGNTAASDGGGAYLRTAAGSSTLFIQNTVSGNSANWRGGGVFAYTQGAAATTTIVHSTITLNKADADANNPVVETGGGVFAGGNGNLKLENTIVAANVDPANHAPDLKNAGNVLAAKGNLIGASGGSGLAPAPIAAPDANGNIVGGAGTGIISPGLAALANNGGPTQTHALLITSAAVNRGLATSAAGVGGVPQFDQRGAPFGRVVQGPGQSVRIDIGAFELSESPATVVFQVDSLGDEDDGDASAGRFSLREAIRQANFITAATTITFAPSLSGQKITLSSGELMITKSMVVDASALAENVTIDAAGKSRVFHTFQNVTLRGLTISGGLSIDGAGVRNEGHLTMVDCTVTNNVASGFFGGGGVYGGAQLTLTGCNFSNNSATETGSAVSLPSGTAIIDDCEFIGNKITAEKEAYGGTIWCKNLELRRSVVSGNVGRGIFAWRSESTLISHCTISNNGSGKNFGGILVDTGGRLTVSYSTISGNKNGGVANIHAGNITITHSTITGNTGQWGGVRGGGDYGGINGYVTIKNCTISANDGPGVTAGFGGLEVSHSTVADNTIGISPCFTGDAPIQISNSIVSGNNVDMFGRGSVRFSLIGVGIGNFQDLGGNLIGSGANPVDAKLGPLADNGGPTLTHALLPDSVAINAGDPDVTGADAFDQRGPGFPRVQGGRLDMGAFEASSGANVPPVITSPTAVNVPENSMTAIQLTATDENSPPQTISFTIIGGVDATKFAVTPGGLLTFPTPPDYEQPTDAGADHTYVVTVNADDGAGGSATQTITVTVTPVNDNLPAFQSAAAVNLAENTLPVLLASAVDADLPARTLTYSIAGGADAAKFEITLGGALSFVEPPKFDAPTDANGDNVYLVTVQASDGEGGATTQAISVTITSSVPPPPASADFNGDGFVTAADLAIWRQNFGTTAGPNPTPGDADGDRDVDGNDFLIWQRTLGQVALPAAAAVVAAEAAEQESAARADQRSFYLDSDVILAPFAEQIGPRAGDRPRRRPEFRPTRLPAADRTLAELRPKSLASSSATDEALAAPSSLSPAAESAFAAIRPDRWALDDAFAAVGEF